MASKRTEKLIILGVGALGAAVLIGKALEPAPVAPLPIVATAPIAMPMAPQPGSQKSGSKSRQMTDADRTYYEGAFASQAQALGDTSNRTREIEGMTQAARDAGYDEVTSQRLGSEAAALCNGDPKCLQ